VGHLRRRGDDYLANLVVEIVGVVRANDDRIKEAGVAADVKAFGEMDLSRGKLKPGGPLRKARAKVDAVMCELGLLSRAIPTKAAPKATAESWEDAVQYVWQGALRQRDPLTAEHLEWVLEEVETEGKAMRLVFLATRSTRRRQEPFEDFRKQVNRQKLRAHPWIVRDTKS